MRFLNWINDRLNDRETGLAWVWGIGMGLLCLVSAGMFVWMHFYDRAALLKP